MRKRRFTEAQLIGILQEAVAGATVGEVCRRHGIAAKTYYRWREHYGGLQVATALRNDLPVAGLISFADARRPPLRPD